MHYEKPDRLLLGDHKKRTTEILNEIRSVAKRKSDDDFSDFVESNEDEFSYNPQVGRYIKDVLHSRRALTSWLVVLSIPFTSRASVSEKWRYMSRSWSGSEGWREKRAAIGRAGSEPRAMKYSISTLTR